MSTEWAHCPLLQWLNTTGVIRHDHGSVTVILHHDTSSCSAAPVRHLQFDILTCGLVNRILDPLLAVLKLYPVQLENTWSLERSRPLSAKPPVPRVYILVGLPKPDLPNIENSAKMQGLNPGLEVTAHASLTTCWVIVVL